MEFLFFFLSLFSTIAPYDHYVAEAAEAKFKEVMTSYEAIKSERKNNRA